MNTNKILSDNQERLQNIAAFDTNGVLETRKLIIFDNDTSIAELTLCLQSILANTNIRDLDISLYTDKSKQLLSEINWVLNNIKEIEVYDSENSELSETLAVIQDKLLPYSGVILMRTQAIVGKNWLVSIKDAASKENIAVVVPREIRHRNDRLAWDLIPYAINSNEIDIALSESTNHILDPGFDEHNSLVSIKKFGSFCLYFNRNVLQKINFKKFQDEPLNNWHIKVSEFIIEECKMHIVYTPKSKVFHSSYFG